MDLKQKNKLLYARAGFGIPLDDVRLQVPINKTVEALFPKSAPAPIEVIKPEEQAQYSPAAMKEAKMEGEEEKKKMRAAYRDRIKELNAVWMSNMVETPYPLLEKTALFWHGHFAARIEQPYFDQKLLEVIRANALGNFGNMLREVSHSAAMLQFLNNQQNKKEHPNENFAREVMELFTLGRGHYTEDDVKEAARAFTGWAHDAEGFFVFRERQHDSGSKKFLGRTGNFNGDDILNILLEQKQTAVFITQKLYRFFVSDEKIEEKRVKYLADVFYDSQYDISALLNEIFTSDWFYHEDIVGAKVKSPVELLVGYQRLLPMSFDNRGLLINLQRVLGQMLFSPPNVAGWPGGKNWIDSSSLVIRMRLPEALLGSKELDLSAKETDPETGMMRHGPGTSEKNNPSFRIAKADADWSQYLRLMKQHTREELPHVIADILLTTPLSAGQLKELTTFADTDSDEEYIKSLTILMMELPEYQLT